MRTGGFVAISFSVRLCRSILFAFPLPAALSKLGFSLLGVPGSGDRLPLLCRWGLPNPNLRQRGGRAGHWTPQPMVTTPSRGGSWSKVLQYWPWAFISIWYSLAKRWQASGSISLAGWVPAEQLVHTSPASFLARASANWLRQALWTHTKAITGLVMGEPPFRSIGKTHQKQHDRHFCQYTHGSSQSSRTGGAKESHRHCHCQFKKVGGSNHTGGSSNSKRKPQKPTEGIGQPEDKQGLHHQRNC